MIILRARLHPLRLANDRTIKRRLIVSHLLIFIILPGDITLKSETRRVLQAEREIALPNKEFYP